MKLLNILKIALTLLLLSACGTDTQPGTVSDIGSGTNSPNNSGNVTANNDVTVTSTVETTGTNDSSISLRITDAPIDNAAKVVITILSIEIKAQNPAQTILFEFNQPKVIDLLTLQGTNTENLLTDVSIKAGEYDELRLIVDDSGMNSFIEITDGSVYPLKIPSGSSSGLKLKGPITIPASKPGKFTVDFDVRKSIVRAGKSSNYLLKPVLRLVDDSVVGHIRGSVDPSLLTDSSCSDNDIDTYNAVYVFEGFDAAVDDIDLSSDQDIDPIATGSIKYDSTSDSYMFEAAFLTEGNYTIALTCNTDLEDIESDDDLVFFNIQNVQVQINDIQFL